MNITHRFSGLVKAAGDVKAFPDIQGEAGLVDKIRLGEDDAIKDLFNAYFDRLYSLVFHEVGKDQSAAEDIVQETFLSAFKSLKKFKGDSRVYTWLVGIAHHKIGDYYRRLKRERRNTIIPSENDSERLELVDTGMSAADMVESAEVKLVVEQALLRLPFDYRQVLLLKYIEEMSVSEICQIMKRSPKSVEGLLTRARRALKENITLPDREDKL
jgi:RNA polymerase sigma-70 factor (ECF subfamily)